MDNLNFENETHEKAFEIIEGAGETAAQNRPFEIIESDHAPGLLGKIRAKSAQNAANSDSGLNSAGRDVSLNSNDGLNSGAQVSQANSSDRANSDDLASQIDEINSGDGLNLDSGLNSSDGSNSGAGENLQIRRSLLNSQPNSSARAGTMNSSDELNSAGRDVALNSNDGPNSNAQTRGTNSDDLAWQIDAMNSSDELNSAARARDEFEFGRMLYPKNPRINDVKVYIYGFESDKDKFYFDSKLCEFSYKYSVAKNVLCAHFEGEMQGEKSREFLDSLNFVGEQKNEHKILVLINDLPVFYKNNF